jgi:hypothetical protein
MGKLCLEKEKRAKERSLKRRKFWRSKGRLNRKEARRVKYDEGEKG